MEAQGIILAAIEGQVGGTAEATANASDKMKESWDEAWEALGTLLLPALDALAEKVAIASDWVQDHTGVVKVIAIALGAFAATILAVNAAIRIYRALQVAVRIATTLWTVAQWALNVAMTANPIGLIIVGIGLLIAIVAALVYYFRGPLTEGLKSVWDWMVKTAAAMREGLGRAVDTVRGKIDAPGGQGAGADRQAARLLGPHHVHQAALLAARHRPGPGTGTRPPPGRGRAASRPSP